MAKEKYKEIYAYKTVKSRFREAATTREPGSQTR